MTVDSKTSVHPNFICNKCAKAYKFDDIMLFVHTERITAFHHGSNPPSWKCSCAVKVSFKKVESWVNTVLGHTSSVNKQISSRLNGLKGGRPKKKNGDNK